MFRYGAPAIVQGGCGKLARTLEQHILAHGGEVRLSCEVLAILHEDGHVTGVRIRDKTTGEEVILNAPLVVSDIGPRATHALLHNRKVTQAEVLKKSGGTQGVGSFGISQMLVGAESDALDIHEAVGLKVHILSDVSFIPHKGIMYCLDTQRIAGIVQPTNSDPDLAPAGKHLLITHQVIQSNNIEEERALALADLRLLFGEAFDKHCRVLTMGTYRGEWPVNRIAQGEDMQAQTAIEGLYMVGDAVKPPGYLMVEGVAQSVNQFLDLLDDMEQKLESRPARPRHVVPPPSRFNALRWLWKAPGNSGKA
jgi:phytoene dehydrogenase-like protein